jgi:hypothetical protein
MMLFCHRGFKFEDFCETEIIIDVLLPGEKKNRTILLQIKQFCTVDIDGCTTKTYQADNLGAGITTSGINSSFLLATLYKLMIYVCKYVKQITK